MSDEKIKLRRAPWEIVVRALSVDVEVVLPDDFTYVMIDGDLCYKLQIWRDGKTFEDEPEVEYRISDIGWNSFKQVCELLSEEDLTNIVYSTVMRKTRNSSLNPLKWDDKKH